MKKIRLLRQKFQSFKLKSLNYNYLQMYKAQSHSSLIKNTMFQPLSSLKKKQFISKLLPLNSLRNTTNDKDEYNEFQVSGLASIIHYIERAENNIKYTPKVIILKQQNSNFKISVQSPKRLLLQYLNHFDDVIKAQILLQIVETLFILSERYGYFYCDKFMFKMSQQRRPVVWINQNFKSNDPEFPIQINSISQTKFINKIRKTLGEIFQFDKDVETGTKIQLRGYLKGMVEKFKREERQRKYIDENSRIRREKKKNNCQKQHKIFDDRTISPQICKQSVQTGAQGTLRYRTTQFPEKHLISENLQKKQKSSRGNKQIRTQRQIESLDQTNKNLLNNKTLSSKSNKSTKNLKIVNNQPKPQRLNPQNHSHVNSSPNHKTTHNLKQDEDTVCSQLLEERLKTKNRLNLKTVEKKNRKKSEDIQMLQSWIKDDRISRKQETKYQNLTFSTALTFNSLKSQLQNILVQNIQKEKCNSKRHQTIENNNGSKQQNVPITITEVEVQKQMDNLFESQVEKQQNDISPELKGVRQSKLFNQLQILFVSSDSIDHEQKQQERNRIQLSQISHQFNDILG